MNSMILVRHVTADDWELMRKVRLAALSAYVVRLGGWSVFRRAAGQLAAAVLIKQRG